MGSGDSMVIRPPGSEIVELHSAIILHKWSRRAILHALCVAHRLLVMFIELAFIDWIALAFAAVLLAGAAAAAVLAYATSRARTSEPKSGYAHAATTSTTTTTQSVASTGATPGAHASDVDNVVDLRDHRPIHSSAEPPRHAANEAFASATADGHAGSSVISLVDDAAGTENAAAEVGDLDESPVLTAVPGEVIELPAQMPVPTVTPIDSGSDRAVELASRAAKLRGRPIAEPVLQESSVHTIEPSAELAGDIPRAEKVPNRAGFSARVPGFFEDPMGRHELRYWDGARWTEYVKERGERFTDPL